jgi:hypothetical protein
MWILSFLLLPLLLLPTTTEAFFLTMAAAAAPSTNNRPTYGGIAHAGVLVSNTKASLVSSQHIFITLLRHKYHTHTTHTHIYRTSTSTPWASKTTHTCVPTCPFPVPLSEAGHNRSI